MMIKKEQIFQEWGEFESSSEDEGADIELEQEKEIEAVE
jgi:hypothetical protein